MVIYGVWQLLPLVWVGFFGYLQGFGPSALKSLSNELIDKGSPYLRVLLCFSQCLVVLGVAELYSQCL